MMRGDSSPEKLHFAHEFELPPDPMAKWESPPVAIVTPPRHIREQRAAAIVRNAPNGLIDRFLAWLRRNSD